MCEASAPISLPSNEGQLEEITGLTEFGIYYVRTSKSCVCTRTGCRCFVRLINMAGHIKNHKIQFHKRPNMASISKSLEKFPLIPDDEPIPHPTTVVAPFPFLELHNGFHCSFCHFACVSRKSMLDHGRGKHPGQMHHPVKARFKSGPVQRFFKSQSGSSYFKVDPLLSDVEGGSDFDVFYSMVEMERKEVQNSAPAISADTSDEVDWDLSPFLARSGWIRQLQGYSTKEMIRRVGLLRRNEDRCLQRIPEMVFRYLSTITNDEMMGRVHPANLKKLNNWKSYVSQLASTSSLLILSNFH